MRLLEIFKNWQQQESLIANLKKEIKSNIKNSGVIYQDEIIALFDEITKELKEGR